MMSMATRAAFALCAAWTALTMMGCGGAEPAAMEDACADVTAQASDVLTGTMSGDRFSAFAGGDRLVIIDGRQGGTWIMPAAAFHGVKLSGELSAEVKLSTGEIVGSIAGISTQPDPAQDGGGELEYVPIPIGQRSDQIHADMLMGRAATLHMSFTDVCGQVAEGSVDMVLEYTGAMK